VVEASLGDTLLKLELAKVAVNDLEDAGGSAGVALGDDSNRNSFSSRLRNLRNELGNMGDRGPLGSIIRGFGNLGSSMLAPLQIASDLTSNMGKVGQSAGALVGIFASLGTTLAALAAAMFVVVFAATALADILGTLVAVAADLVAPVTLLLGLLGGLAAGFVIGGKRAAEGGGKLNEFSKIVDTLGSMFQKTSSILAHVFLPYFVELGHAAEKALLFIDRIIKLPLGQAFRALDTRGTKLLSDFVERVAQVLSKPLRLAFHVAFEDTAFANMVADWWHRFVGFLFGTTERHPVEIRPGVFKISKTTVDGVFQPFIDWFDRQNFTHQGIQIGHKILNGIMTSGMRHRLADFIGDVFKDVLSVDVATDLIDWNLVNIVEVQLSYTDPANGAVNSVTFESYLKAPGLSGTEAIYLALSAGVNVAVAAVHLKEFLLDSALAGSGLPVSGSSARPIPKNSGDTDWTGSVRPRRSATRSIASSRTGWSTGVCKPAAVAAARAGRVPWTRNSGISPA
jgi:hypothetical protein